MALFPILMPISLNMPAAVMELVCLQTPIIFSSNRLVILA